MADYQEDGIVGTRQREHPRVEAWNAKVDNRGLITIEQSFEVRELLHPLVVAGNRTAGREVEARPLSRPNLQRSVQHQFGNCAAWRHEGPVQMGMAKVRVDADGP